MLTAMLLCNSGVSNDGFWNAKFRSLSRNDTLVLPNAASRDETGKSRNLYTPLPACENILAEKSNKNNNICVLLKNLINK